jgi:hypothetical protein
VTDTPLIPSALYGLRTWRPAEGDGGPRLAGPQSGAVWPTGGDWLEARCSREDGHAAPAADCTCGIHAWHPRRGSARTVLAARREIPGVVEACGAVEVHEDGFRAERARPYALVAVRGRNAALVRRLAAAYETAVIDAAGPAELLDWCRERGLGLGADAVDAVLGPGEAATRHRARRAAARRQVLRVAAAIAVGAALVLAGLALTDKPPPGTEVKGRAGEFITR